MSNFTTNALIGTIDQSTKAIRSFTKNENLLMLLVEKQIAILPIVRKKNPELLRTEAIVISLLNAAAILKREKKSEKVVFSIIQKTKSNPQFSWLKLRRNYILNLNAQGASLRGIQDAIYFRFHHKISHTQIAKFLKMEVENAS